MKSSVLFASVLLFAAASCERHDWEKTKVLHESHGDHGEHHHGADHGEEESGGTDESAE